MPVFNNNRRRPPMKKNLIFSKTVSAPGDKIIPDLSTPGEKRLRVIPLGGLEEVGRNMTVIEYGDDILIVDMGLMFPSENMPGVDYVLPDTAYLQQNKHKIRGIFITHGHLDHTGAIPYLIQRLGMPTVYGTKFTIGMIRDRLEEFNLQNSVRTAEVHPDDNLQLGPFALSFFRVNHNIFDAVGAAIKTPIGTIVVTGDWKFDHTPHDGQHTEFGKIALLGKEGVLLLCSDSTNAEKEGYCISEQVIQKSLLEVFSKAEGRIIISVFSSLLSRIQQIILAAHDLDRKVAVSGMSMEKALTVAVKLGYVKIPKGCLIKMDEVNKYPDQRVVMIVSGSQGQENSSLGRMASGEHRQVKIQPNDTVVLSASPIPGNERAIATLMNKLFALGAEVVYNKMFDVHASGHAHREELKLMLSLVRPKYFMPYHGERSMLEQHGKLAKAFGLDPRAVFTMSNGEVLEFNANQQARVSKTKIETDDIMVDGLGVGDISNVVLRDRQVLAEDGMMVIIATVGADDKIIGIPDVISRGFVYVKEAESMINEVKTMVSRLIDKHTEADRVDNWASLRTRVRDEVGQLLFKKIERRPMILPVIIKV